jgi:protein-glutamine gamma-glutamyltransferase
LLFDQFLKEKRFRLKLSLWSLLLYIAVAMPFMAQDNITVVAATLILFSISFVLQLQNFKLLAIFRLLLLIGSLIFIKELFGTLRGLEPGVAFLSFLLGIKMFEMNEKRDFFIFTLIIELFLVGQLLSEDSIAMVAYVFMTSLFLFYLMFCLSGETKNHQLLDVERILVTIKIFMHSIPLMLILYFFFPRMNVGHLFPFSINTKSSVGFTEEINPGDIAKLSQTDDPIFRVKFNKNPSRDQLYFKGSVLAYSRGFSWRKKKINNKHLYIFDQKQNYIYDVIFNDLHSSQVFAIENTSKIIKKSSGLILKQAANTWKFVPYNNQKIRYQGITTSAKFKIMTSMERKLYLQLPKNIPAELIKFANQQRQKYQSTANLLTGYRMYILSNDFIYSMEPGSYQGMEGLEDFFFKRKKGYCEHYASVLALLLRINEVPSRIVVGFQGGDFNEIGQYYLLKTKDAHAWVEYFDEQQGWKRVDPTFWLAPSRIELGATEFNQTHNIPDGVTREEFLSDLRSNLFSKFFKFFDMAYYQLNAKFLEFDFQSQKKLFKKINLNISRPYQLMVGLIVFSSAFFIVYFYFFLKNASSLNEVEQKYLQFLAKLQKRGVCRLSHQGPMAILKDLDDGTVDYNEICWLLKQFSFLKYSKFKDLARLKELKERIKKI